MTRTFVLPDLGEGLTEAEIVKWLVAEGDEVTVDQAVAEVETAKSVVEVPTPYAGVVETLCAGEGETLEVGLPLLEVAEPAGAEPAVAEPAGAEPAGHEAYRDEERAGSGNVLVGYGTSGGAGGPGPRRRRRPRSTGELAHGTRPAGAPGHGAARAGDPPQMPAGTRIAMSSFQKAAAAALSRSRAEIPEATIWVDVDFTALCDLRAGHPAGPGLLAYVARFVTAALAEHPVLNARVDAERQEIVQPAAVNLGLAVQGDRGLVAPAVLGAEGMTTARLDGAIRDLVVRARDGRTTTEELTAGTFTLNNYGRLGVDGSAPIINHPQVAMLGIGRIIDRPWVTGGGVRPRRIAQVSFVFDHRVCDGVEAAAFLRAVADAVEDPLSSIARL